MRRLTKRQIKDNERIQAWLQGVPFKENARDKNPKVPELTIDDVMETYTPRDISGSGQFFTPFVMGVHLISHQLFPVGAKVLEPSAGIGNLIHALHQTYPPADDGYEITAFEIDDECMRIGQRLHSTVDWRLGSPFAYIEELAGRFDYVIMNPPFGTRRGLDEAQRYSDWKKPMSRIEHCFLNLAIRALKPGGVVLALAPWGFIENLPKGARAGFDDQAALAMQINDLPGEFANTAITVDGFIIEKLEVCEPVAEQVDLLDLDWFDDVVADPVAEPVPEATASPLKQTKNGQYFLFPA